MLNSKDIGSKWLLLHEVHSAFTPVSLLPAGYLSFTVGTSYHWFGWLRSRIVIHIKCPINNIKIDPLPPISSWQDAVLSPARDGMLGGRLAQRKKEFYVLIHSFIIKFVNIATFLAYAVKSEYDYRVCIFFVDLHIKVAGFHKFKSIYSNYLCTTRLIIASEHIFHVPRRSLH